MAIRAKAALLHVLWKKYGYGYKGPLKGLTEEDLTDMTFLKSNAKMIMGQLELMFAPIGLPAFVATVVPAIAPFLEHKEHECHEPDGIEGRKQLKRNSRGAV